MKNLCLNGTHILNFLDLQSQFSPLALYQQLGTLEGFAAVHCVPLPLLLTSLESGKQYHAEFLTKEFWFSLLRCAAWPKCETALQCIGHFLECTREEEGDEALQAQEQADAQLEEKLAFIERAAHTKQDYRKTVLLLAICELAEIDPRKTTLNDWSVPGEETEHAISVSAAGPTLFPYQHTVSLTTGAQVYSYWFHDGDQLEPGATIQTVRIEAKSNGNQYAVVRLELHSQKTKQCVQSVLLHSGEFVYCTVSNGSIIRFLPSVSSSEDLCILRPDFQKTDLQIIPKNSEAWTLHTSYISDFSAGPKHVGFLFVQEGRVNAKFYKPAEDYLTRLQLEMLMLPAVEVQVEKDSYEVLLEDGSVISNRPGAERKGVLSLHTAEERIRIEDGRTFQREEGVC